MVEMSNNYIFEEDLIPRRHRGKGCKLWALPIPYMIGSQTFFPNVTLSKNLPVLVDPLQLSFYHIPKTRGKNVKIRTKNGIFVVVEFQSETNSFRNRKGILIG